MATTNDLMSALQMISQLPQTAAEAKSNIEAGLQSAETKVTDFAYAHLALSAVSVVVGFATFLVLLRRCTNEERMALNGSRPRALNGSRRASNGRRRRK